MDEVSLGSCSFIFDIAMTLTVPEPGDGYLPVICGCGLLLCIMKVITS